MNTTISSVSRRKYPLNLATFNSFLYALLSFKTLLLCSPPIPPHSPAPLRFLFRCHSLERPVFFSIHASVMWGSVSLRPVSSHISYLTLVLASVSLSLMISLWFKLKKLPSLCCWSSGGEKKYRRATSLFSDPVMGPRVPELKVRSKNGRHNPCLGWHPFRQADLFMNAAAKFWHSCGN